MKIDKSQLETMPLFRHLSSDELAIVQKNIKVLNYDERECIFMAQSNPDSMYLIDEGKVDIFIEKTKLATLKEGCFFGEMSLLSERVRSASVIVFEGSILYEIPKEIFDIYFKSSANIMQEIALELEKRLRLNNEEVVAKNIELEKKYQELEEATINLMSREKLSSIGLMASSIAHEIRNPLSIINGNSNKAKRCINEGDFNKAKDSINKILEMSERINKIVSGIHSYSRERINEQVFEKINLSKLIEDSYSLCLSALKTNNVEFINNSGLADLEIYCDITQLSQVFVNLILNSIHEISKLDEKWVKIDCEKAKNYIEIRIIDSGNGIDEKIVHNIFDPLFSTKKVGEGSGLGLSICKNIVLAHEGEIYVDTSCSNTTFCIKIPIK